MMHERTGFLFTLDALIGAMIIIAGLLFISSLREYHSDTTQLASASSDVLVSLEAIQVRDIHNSWVATCIANGTIDNANSTVLEQIGQFWAIGDAASAQKLSEIFLNSTYPSYGVRLTIENMPLYARNSTSSKEDTIVASRMVTGVAQGKAITGSSASAYLRRIKDKRNAIFLPFGGFVGEGNITVKTGDLPFDANVTDVILELDTERAFDLSINGNACDRLVPTPAPLVPSVWSRMNCSPFIVPGANNSFSLNFTGTLNGSSIAGGYIKILYLTDQFNDAQASANLTVYHFPNIVGLTNLYDSIYVPGTVESMNVSLRFFSNYSGYFMIGNASFPFTGQNVTQNMTINDSSMRLALAAVGMNYTTMSRQTVPLRFGIGDVVVIGNPSDVVIVSDTSGSMSECATTGLNPPCPPGDQSKINASKNVTTNFIGYLFNGTLGMRIGLSEFSNVIKSFYNLTTNSTPLIAQVATYTPTSTTCICCGINNATNILNAEGQVIYIPRSTPGWRYNDTNLASPPAGWNTSAYNDAGWKNTTTSLGWSYAGLTTTIPVANRYQGSYYYRRNFTVADASKIIDAKLYVYSDDGADVYLNGVRIDNDYPNIHSAFYWNRNGIIVNKSAFITGNNIIAVRQYHNGGSSNRMGFDLQLSANTKGNTTTTQNKNIVLMTDGIANVQCSEQNTGDPLQDAIKASCDAYTNYGIVVYTVGFGTDADNNTLSAMANCTTGQYFRAGNATALQDAFDMIGNSIIKSSSTQTAIVLGNITQTTLYGDSDIEITNTPDVMPAQPNEISITLQSDPLPNCSSTFTLYDGMRVLDARVNSYSADYWTDLVLVNNNLIYNLSNYAPLYASLGDPYQVRFPQGALHTGNNTIYVGIGTDATNMSITCSQNNTIIYTVAINLSTERSDAVPLSSGCVWRVAFADGTLMNLTIPSSYSGNQSCSYRPGNITFNANDAYQLGAYSILSKLDFKRDGTIFVNLQNEDLEVIVTTISKVPYLWGPSIARLEVTR